MKQIGIYILSVLFIMAVHGQCIDYILKTISKHYICLNEDFYCEEDSEDGKKSYEEDDKDLSDKLLSGNYGGVLISGSIPSCSLEKNNFYLSQYCKIIYSPPKSV